MISYLSDHNPALIEQLSYLSILLIYIIKCDILPDVKPAIIELLKELVLSSCLSILLISISSRAISYLMISQHLWNYLKKI